MKKVKECVVCEIIEQAKTEPETAVIICIGMAISMGRNGSTMMVCRRHDKKLARLMKMVNKKVGAPKPVLQ